MDDGPDITEQIDVFEANCDQLQGSMHTNVSPWQQLAATYTSSRSHGISLGPRNKHPRLPVQFMLVKILEITRCLGSYSISAGVFNRKLAQQYRFIISLLVIPMDDRRPCTWSTIDIRKYRHGPKFRYV